jgi:ketosteroid isomerase-like protein
MSHHESSPSNRASDAAVDVVRRLNEAFQSGGPQAASELIADDIEWHEIGRTEGIHGKEALAARGQEPDAQSWDITGETHDIVANGDHVVALITAHAKRADGTTLDYKVAEVYHVRDGKITGRWAMSDDTEAINRFFKG